MIKLETRELEDLSEDQREELESTYIDAIDPIQDAFRKEIEQSPENPGWALESAIENAKNIPGPVKSYLEPVAGNNEMRYKLIGMLGALKRYAQEAEWENNKRPKSLDDLIEYGSEAQRLSRNASFTLGDFLAEAIANEDILSKDQVADMAYEILLDACLKKVDKDVVNSYLIDAGNKVSSYGLKNMKKDPSYSLFVSLAKDFKEASKGYKDPGMSPR